jgi:hypothetical protein
MNNTFLDFNNLTINPYNKIITCNPNHYIGKTVRLQLLGCFLYSVWWVLFAPTESGLKLTDWKRSISYLHCFAVLVCLWVGFFSQFTTVDMLLEVLKE